ncbi:MAG: hypothetical protein WA110_07080 [Anaerolineaceae bacterium]
MQQSEEADSRELERQILWQFNLEYLGKFQQYCLEKGIPMEKPMERQDVVE